MTDAELVKIYENCKNTNVINASVNNKGSGEILTISFTDLVRIVQLIQSGKIT